MNAPAAPAPPRPTSRAVGCLAAGLGVLVLAGLVALVLSQYSIKAFSDPYNWLTYARDLTHQFGTSRWPVTYPAFLFLMLKLMGPYGVFLSNLPVLLILLGLASALSCAIARDTEERDASIHMGLTTLCLLVGVCPSLYVYLANPYRDPLSHLLLLAAVLCFIRFIRRPRQGSVAISCAGLLLGLSASIREPAVLMILPLAVAGLATLPPRPFRPLALSALRFGLFFTLGLSPLLVQMYTATDQLLLPPQVVREGALLPGFDFTQASRNFDQALNYYRDCGGWLWGPALLAGLAMAVARRNRLLLALVLPALLLYAVVYTHYRSFVERYFFIVTLWAAPLAAYGLHQAATWPARILRRPALARGLQVALSCALAGWAIYRLATAENEETRFRITDARAFTRDFRAVVPAGAHVICPRNLCEIITYFTPSQSEAATALVRDDPRNDAVIFDHYQAMLSNHRPVYFMKLWSLGDKNDDENLLRRFFDLEPVAGFSPDRYHLKPVTGAERLELFRVKPRTALHARFELPATQPGAILQFDAGRLSAIAPARIGAQLSCDGHLLDSNLTDGVHYYPLPAGAREINLTSDAPVGITLTPRILDPLEPLNLNFGVLSGFCHDGYLSASIRETPLQEPHARRVRGEGSIRLPTPWPADVLVIPRLHVRGARTNGTEPIPLEVDAPSGVHTRYEVQDSSIFRTLRLPTLHPAGGGHLTLNLRTPDAKTWVELDRLLLHPLPPAPALSLDVGTQQDFVHLEEGFYDAESRRGATSARWTTGRATVVFNLAAPVTSVNVELTYLHQQRPARAPPEEVHLIFNNQPIVAPGPRLTVHEGVAKLVARIPAACVRAGANRLTVVTPPWNPRDYGSADNRTLGILLDRIELHPVEP